MSVNERIGGLVQGTNIILFMKGNRQQPRCGFSASVVSILDEYLEEYETVDVLEDEAIREGIKSFSSWPTIPQLYVAGEFVGGCDIVKEMEQAGELSEILGVAMRELVIPEITLKDGALQALRGFSEGKEIVVRLEIPASFEYGMDFGEEKVGDVLVEGKGFTLLLSRASARRADGMTIDFMEGPGGGGFKIDNPNEPPKVRQLPPEELKRRMDEGAPMEIFDVRTDREVGIAPFPSSRLLDEAGKALLEELDKGTPLVFVCHHGNRSQAAASHCLRMGFREVYNLSSGIDGWSREVDPSVPRY